MELTEQIAMVLAVFALLGGSLWWFRKRGVATFAFPSGRNVKTRRVEVLERISLTPQHALHVVRVAGKTVLIGTAPSTCTLLDASISESHIPSDLVGSKS